jgi:hypothetical protein
MGGLCGQVRNEDSNVEAVEAAPVHCSRYSLKGYCGLVFVKESLFYSGTSNSQKS